MTYGWGQQPTQVKFEQLTPEMRTYWMESTAKTHRQLTMWMSVLSIGSMLLLAITSPALEDASDSGVLASCFALGALVLIVVLTMPIMSASALRRLRMHMAQQERFEGPELVGIFVLGTYLWLVPALFVGLAFGRRLLPETLLATPSFGGPPVAIFVLTAAAMALTVGIGCSLLLGLVHERLFDRWPSNHWWAVSALMAAVPATYMIVAMLVDPAMVPPWAWAIIAAVGGAQALPLYWHVEDVTAALRADQTAAYLHLADLDDDAHPSTA